jgi:hypothetical protein
MAGLNQYTELLYYIKSLGEADVFINTITQGKFDALDLDKKNIFPLLHINITGSQFTNGQTVIFNVELGAFDIRDINKNIEDDKFWDNDNEVDNLNETLSVLNRIWVSMNKNFAENDITASENPSLEPIVEAYTNILDGWILTFDVELPNTTLNLCT